MLTSWSSTRLVSKKRQKNASKSERRKRLAQRRCRSQTLRHLHPSPAPTSMSRLLVAQNLVKRCGPCRRCRIQPRTCILWEAPSLSICQQIMRKSCMQVDMPHSVFACPYMQKIRVTCISLNVSLCNLDKMVLSLFFCGHLFCWGVKGTCSPIRDRSQHG